jgi:hypothetical protein
MIQVKKACAVGWKLDSQYAMLEKIKEMRTNFRQLPATESWE